MCFSFLIVCFVFPLLVGSEPTLEISLAPAKERLLSNCYSRSQKIIIIHCPLAAHKPGTSARTYQPRFPDPAHWDSDRHYNRLNVHPDQSASYIHSSRCLLTNGFHGYRVCKSVISSSSKRSAWKLACNYMKLIAVSLATKEVFIKENYKAMVDSLINQIVNMLCA